MTKYIYDEVVEWSFTLLMSHITVSYTGVIIHVIV